MKRDGLSFDVRVTFRLTQKMRERLDNLAKSEGKVLSEIIRERIEIPEANSLLHSKGLQNVRALSSFERFGEFSTQLNEFKLTLKQMVDKTGSGGLQVSLSRINGIFDKIEKVTKEWLSNLERLKYF